jgi:WD40 repeat protein
MKYHLNLLCCIICFFSITSCTKTNTDTNTPPNKPSVDSVGMLTGWWAPKNNLVQGKIYFGTDHFFYVDTVQKKSQYSGFWKLKNTTISCSATIGGPVQLQFKISDLTKSKLTLTQVGVGVPQPFNKTNEPPITSPPLTSIAGTGITGFSGDGGLATAAKLQGEGGIATDSFGNVIFVDNAVYIRQVSLTDGKISSYTHTASYGLYSLAYDKTANICFASGYDVFKTATLNDPIVHIAGLGYDKRGFDGDTPREANKARLNFVNSIAIDKNGDIFIVDSYNNRLRKISAATNLISTVAMIPTNSESLTIDAAGNIYMGGNHYIYMIPVNTSTLIKIAGKKYTDLKAFKPGDGGLATEAMFKYVSGVTISSKGDIYVADGGDNTVRKIDATTKIITKVAGTGYAGKTDEGLHATAYSLFLPRGLATDKAGNFLYITDSSFRIHRVAIN